MTALSDRQLAAMAARASVVCEALGRIRETHDAVARGECLSTQPFLCEEAWRVARAASGDDVPALLAEVHRQRAILAGRATEPTGAEVDAHDGAWLVRCGERGDAAVPCVLWMFRGDYVWPSGCIRWWPLDDQGTPCDWPVPS